MRGASQAWLFEPPDREMEALTELVPDEMENVSKLTVPLVVEIGVGANWRDLE
jgi:DNA polymerase-1